MIRPAASPPPRIVPGEMKFAVAATRRATAAKGATAKAAPGTGIKAARIAAFVDLAGIEFGALVLVAQNVIGAGDFLETLLGLGVARMGVRMVFLGQVAEGLLDFGFAGALGHAQDLIGIAHSNSNRTSCPI